MRRMCRARLHSRMAWLLAPPSGEAESAQHATGSPVFAFGLECALAFEKKALLCVAPSLGCRP